MSKLTLESVFEEAKNNPTRKLTLEEASELARQLKAQDLQHKFNSRQSRIDSVQAFTNQAIRNLGISESIISKEDIVSIVNEDQAPLTNAEMEGLSTSGKAGVVAQMIRDSQESKKQQKVDNTPTPIEAFEAEVWRNLKRIPGAPVALNSQSRLEHIEIFTK